MIDEVEDATDLDIALSMLDGYGPLAVANALTNFHHAILNFHSNHVLQAQLILKWDAEFAKQVLATWKPSEGTWTEVIGRAEDAEHAVKLMLPALGSAGVRSAIAVAGSVHGGAKQVKLMNALHSLLTQERRIRSAINEGGTLDVSPHGRLPIAPPASDSLPRPHSKESSANTSTTSHPLTVSTKDPLTPIIGSTSSAAIMPQHSRSGQLVTPNSTKENIHPSALTDLKYAKSRPTSLQSTQGGPTNIQKLFAADDARRTPIVNKTVAVPQSPETPSRNRPNDKTSDASLLSRISEEKDDHMVSARTSVRRAPTPAPSSPSDEEYESGMDDMEPIIPQKPASLPRVDGFSAGKDSGDEQASSNDGSERSDGSEDYGGDYREDYGEDYGEGYGEDYGEGYGEDYDRSERGADSGDEHGTLEFDEAPIPNEEDYPDGYLDPSSLNPWAWSRETNDEKVELWGVEDQIRRDPRSTAPVRTKWMYEARKGEMSDEDYSTLLHEEHEQFLDIPVACRTAVGQMWYKDNKLDWEIRVFLAPLIYQYALLKDKCEAAEEEGDLAEVKRNEANRRSLATEAMAKLMERFPDCSPNHELRMIKDKFGKKELGKYIAKFRNKFTSDTGRMKTLYQKSVGKVRILGPGVSMSTLLQILGRKHAKIAFHLWGKSEDGGQAECDEEIAEEMAKWVERHPKATTDDINQYRVQVVQEVRKANFELLGDEEQEKWTKRAKFIHKPATVEEEQCFVEATLPHIVDLLKLLAERGNMHFVLLASSKSSCDIPIFVQEFGRKNVEQSIFLSATDGLGARVRVDYIDYALKRFGGGIDDAVILMDTAPTGDLDINAEVDELGANTGASKGRRRMQPAAGTTVVPPFKPNIPETRTIQKMAKAISEFVIMGIEKLHRIRASWDKLTKEASTFIIVERMPMDPDVPNQRLQLQKPAAMTNARLKTFFKFLIASYDGTLPNHECFRFRLESRHLNIPTPVAPANPEVHHAAEAAAKTKLPKRKRGESEPKGKKGKRPRKDDEEIIEGFDYDNYEGIMQEADAAFLDDAFMLSATGKAQTKAPRKGKALRFESPPQSPKKSHNLPTVLSSKPKGSRPTASSKPITPEAPDKPPHRPKPKAKPKSAIILGTDKLSHSLLLPDNEETAKIWLETKQYLDLWGENMTHCDEQSRKMPFLGLSGIKHSIDLPAALYSSISILQLWSVFQADSASDFDVTLRPNLGLSTVKPAHHISKIVSLIIDCNKPLPSAKFIHNQAHISSDAACALFLQIETAVSRFMDGMVASEKSVLDSNLNLLQGMRIASFMGATGFIRDGGKTGPNVERTSALSDRFVRIVAAIAFARYLNLVLGRVAKLYVESTEAPDTKTMWKELESLWRPGCDSLARAIVARRSDLFDFNTQVISLPRNFQGLVDFAFELRPWWTPGAEGVPGLVSVSNKQAVASVTFFKLLKGVNWTKCSFIERGQILLLVFIGAIQIETGRVKTKEGKPQTESPARLLADSLSAFRRILEDSGEDGPTEQQILIPDDQVSTWLSKWEMECQLLADDSAPSIAPADENPPSTRPPPMTSGKSGVSSSTPASVHPPSLTERPPGDGDSSGPADSQAQACSLRVKSAASEATSRVSYEEEDPTFPSSNAATASSEIQRSALPPSSQSAILLPAVRPLDDAPLPPAKRKRKTREVEVRSLDEIDQGPRKLRSAAAPQPVQEAPPITLGRGSTPRGAKATGLAIVQGTTSTRVTRSTATAPSAGRGQGRGANRTVATTPSRRGSSKRGR